MTWPKLALELALGAALAGGLAVLTDRRAHRRERAAEADFPPTGPLITVMGTRVHAHVQGQGPDLVLIHGASGNTRDFTFGFVDRLARAYRVIVLDRPGLGWSDPLPRDGRLGDPNDPAAQARVLRAAVADLGVTRPLVLGHSYGGAVAMAWGLAAPQETAALVILAGATMPWPGGLGAFYAVMSSALGARLVIPAVTAFASHARADAVVAGIFAPDPVPAGYAAHVGPALTMRRDTLRENARQVAGLKPFIQRMAREYPGLHLPVEILHGTADSIVPARIHAEALAALLPDAALTLLPGVAHMPHHIAPDAVVAAIDRAAARAGLR